MKKIYGLWFVQIFFSVLGISIVILGYMSMNILSLYAVMFAPILITAIVYFFLIFRGKIHNIIRKKIYFTCLLFSLTAMVEFSVTDIIIRSERKMYEIIVANTKEIIDGKYLIIKENSNLVDYIFIFALAFLIFWLISRGNKIDENRSKH